MAYIKTEWVDNVTNLDDDALNKIETELATLDGNVATNTASIATKANIAQEAWIAPTLLNGWVNYSPTQMVGYMKDAMGFVHLKGLMKSGTMSSAAFNLPVGYRPTQDSQQIVISIGALGQIYINVAGNVTATVGSNLWISLDGITFKAV